VKRRAPFGFFVAGACAAWFGFWMVVVLCTMDPAGDDGPWSAALSRGMAAVLAALSAVVTEALWRVRPWAYRASVALAVAYAAAVLVTVAATGEGVESAVLVLLASAVVVVPILGYVESRSQVLWPPGPAQVRTPVPAHGGGRP